MTRLSLNQLDQLPGTLAAPGYSPTRRKVGIVHLGIGNFHRAHQAVYVDDLLAKTDGHWRILGVSLRSGSMRDKMMEQDFLYTLREQDEHIQRLRVIGAIADVLVAPENPSAVIEAMASPDVHMVSLTVTEKGYYLQAASRQLDLQHADIQSDITGGQAPITIYGFLLAACRLRMQRQLPGFNVLSCDNLPDNSHLLGQALIAAARLQDTDLAHWIERELAFCNTMVDRIVPATTRDDQLAISEQCDMEDSGSLSAETYRQWVIENNFKGEYPDFSQVGALLVDNVAPYETMKLRLLNGCHSALAYLGALRGHDTIHQAITDPVLRTFVSYLMNKELAPTLSPLPGVNLLQYQATIVQRFANHRVPYRCHQVASDGSQKLPQRLLAAATELKRKGQSANGIACVVGAWLAFLIGSNNQSNYSVNDPGAERLLKMIEQHKKKTDYPNTDQVNALLTHSGIVPATLLADSEWMHKVLVAVQALLSNTSDKLLSQLTHA
ncbi:mannitol dehydrogenase family protein [Simiduia agarivorans]|uniref:D-mannonate oxidoreductase n=1 Tax=Simiduia agarivorans (strain DSM 21679 / JCM 13881 / BCRC 17597 / SA1) TaxID=1117647 RepID=K4KY02_SIMAS|nr:mannitol dehydrogenase family protein [Simiduia agarivorans]AFU98812.1 D-mannonate oxidoreductase [Simiduia agarivorans SA1 = DSM 21679]